MQPRQRCLNDILMSEERQQNINVVVADETISFKIDASDEEGFRKGAHAVDQRWKRMCKAHPNKSSHYILATVAMAFAGLSYKQSAQLEEQSALLAKLESDLDALLLKVDA